MTARALIILHPGFEEIEAVTPIDLLARAGVDVVQAALGEQMLVPGRNGMTLQATHCLSDLGEQAFDALILPGGPGILQIRQHPLICQLLQKQQAAGKLIGCICAAPLLLLDAGLHNNLRYTCHPTAETELTAALSAPVVQDGTIITSRGAGTATEFALQLVRHLVDHATAADIAASISWPHLLPCYQ
jgi:4-methyl-5(b-hydroxyethyl)-thiazole monophosphate biosynthesis